MAERITYLRICTCSGNSGFKNAHRKNHIAFTNHTKGKAKNPPKIKNKQLFKHTCKCTNNENPIFLKIQN